MKFPGLAVGLIVLVTSTRDALGWGRQGHKLTGAVAFAHVMTSRIGWRLLTRCRRKVQWAAPWAARASAHGWLEFPGRILIWTRPSAPIACWRLLVLV
ncbi:MAG: hypothetical protein JWO48_1669 [Bryobacterales bacterium]|nr:hypothetical protein [Bryobacterales bacterium]